MWGAQQKQLTASVGGAHAIFFQPLNINWFFYLTYWNVYTSHKIWIFSSDNVWRRLYERYREINIAFDCLLGARWTGSFQKYKWWKIMFTLWSVFVIVVRTRIVNIQNYVKYCLLYLLGVWKHRGPNWEIPLYLIDILF